MNVAIEELKQKTTTIAAKVRTYIAIDKTDYLKISKGSFTGKQIKKKKDVMMISLWPKNRNSFGELFGVSLQTIRRMQSGYKACKVKLMLKKRKIQILPPKV